MRPSNYRSKRSSTDRSVDELIEKVKSDPNGQNDALVLKNKRL